MAADHDGITYSFSDDQIETLRWVRFASGFLSTIGSTIIIRHIFARRKGSKCYHQIILGLSVADVVSSLRVMARATYTWNPGLGYPSPLCTWDGAGKVTSGVPLCYNGALSVYFAAVVRYQMREREIRRRILPVLHLISIAYPVILAIIGVPFKMYGPRFDFPRCIATAYPNGCNKKNSGVECIQGKGAKIFSIFSIIPVMIVWAIVIVNNVSIYLKVRKVEKRNERYAGQNSNGTPVTMHQGRSNDRQYVSSAPRDQMDETHRTSRTWSQGLLRLSSKISAAIASQAAAMHNDDELEDDGGERRPPSSERAKSRTSHLVCLSPRSLFRKTKTKGAGAVAAAEQRRATVQRQSSSCTSSSYSNKQRRVATQSFLFVFAYFITTVWSCVRFVLGKILDPSAFEGDRFFWLHLLVAIFYPMLGVFDCLMYLRPRYLLLRGVCRGASRWFVLRNTLFATEPVEKIRQRYVMDKQAQKEEQMEAKEDRAGGVEQRQANNSREQQCMEEEEKEEEAAPREFVESMAEIARAGELEPSQTLQIQDLRVSFVEEGDDWLGKQQQERVESLDDDDSFDEC